ncbi:MAG: peroxiredoxin [Thermoplasmata archaeon]|nr:peroxiredoxin [Thermoplasmata archaeon]MCI4354205.1 peroxiredoxin [Thermoplasmata archaeon]
MPSIGQPAPEFTAPTATGATLKLSSLRGHPVILYFYPEADTPGCTVESKGFRDIYPELKRHQVEVVGVSCDAVDKQCAFAEKYHLPFPLVADASKAVATSYDVLRPSGRARRVTFLIAGDGKIQEIIDSSEAAKHVARASAVYLKS